MDAIQCARTRMYETYLIDTNECIREKRNDGVRQLRDFLPMHLTKTHIIATVGPASCDRAVLENLIEAGADIVRLNFSWGTHEWMANVISTVKSIEKDKGISVPVLQDLSGPRENFDGGHHLDKTKNSVITDKDREDLVFGLDQGVGYVALSYVSGASDIVELRELMKQHGRVVPIIAKIERPEAVEALESIVDESDGVMVARGDLGIAMPIEELPFTQRHIIVVCNKKQKPVIVATEMLLSMTNNPSPTRAEVNDVATAVDLGANAVMLSEESARGKYPVESVAMMHKIVSYAEREKALSQ